MSGNSGGVSSRTRGRISKQTSSELKPQDAAKNVIRLMELKNANRLLLSSANKVNVKSTATATAMDTTTTTTTTHNKFSALPSDVNTSVDQPLTDSSSQQNKKTTEHVSPIVVQGIEINKLIEAFKKVNIVDYKFKLLSVGIKITFVNKTDYTKTKTLLTNENIEHYTFSNPQSNPFKVILHGLTEFTVEEITNELIANEILVENIMQILPLKGKEKVYNMHKNISYLIKFEKSQISMQRVKQIKSLFNIVVRWFPYVNFRKGPTQCRRCQMYGHGTSYCGRILKCLNCGENHDVLNCKSTEKKCANCGEAHEANSKICTKRNVYIAIRENVNINRQLKNISHRPKNIVNNENINRFSNKNIEMNDINFPSYQSRSHNADQANWLKNFSSSIPCTGPQLSQQNVIPAASNKDLFNIDELTSLINDLTQQISACTTRAQQFKVIATLSLQYLGLP